MGTHKYIHEYPHQEAKKKHKFCTGFVIAYSNWLLQYLSLLSSALISNPYHLSHSSDLGGTTSILFEILSWFNNVVVRLTAPLLSSQRHQWVCSIITGSSASSLLAPLHPHRLLHTIFPSSLDPLPHVCWLWPIIPISPNLSSLTPPPLLIAMPPFCVGFEVFILGSVGFKMLGFSLIM